MVFPFEFLHLLLIDILVGLFDSLYGRLLPSCGVFRLFLRDILRIQINHGIVRGLNIIPQKGESDFVDMSKGFSTERDRLERVIADGEKQLAELDEKQAAGDNRRELIEKYTNLEHLTREIVETLIDYISVGSRIPGTRNVPIEIHWNF